MENFLQFFVWFERRLVYIKSVFIIFIGIVNYVNEIYYYISDYCFVQYIYVLVICFVIVGYILGLGDRYIQNILIDINTVELVYIDLGMLRCFYSIDVQVLCCLKCGIFKR